MQSTWLIAFLCTCFMQIPTEPHTLYSSFRPGVVTVFEKEGAAKKFFVSSGTITINDDSSVQILAEEAHPVEDLDAGAAKQVRCAK